MKTIDKQIDNKNSQLVTSCYSAFGG